MHELCTSNIYYDFNLLTQSRKLPIMELQSVISSMRETKPSEDLKSFWKILIKYDPGSITDYCAWAAVWQDWVRMSEKEDTLEAIF